MDGREYHAHVPSRGFLSLAEAAQVACVNPSTIWRWMRAGKLSGRGGARPVRVSELLRFLGARKCKRG